MDDNADILRRLRRIEDRFDLSDLVARYGQLLDDRDLDAVAELYSEDSSFDSLTGPVSGRRAVVGYYAERLGAGGVTYHYPHSQVITFSDDDDDSATGVVHAHAEMEIDGITLVIALRYLDEYSREGGRWRFRSRTAQQLYALPLDELATQLGSDTRKRWPGMEPMAADIPESLPSWQAFEQSRRQQD